RGPESNPAVVERGRDLEAAARGEAGAPLPLRGVKGTRPGTGAVRFRSHGSGSPRCATKGRSPRQKTRPRQCHRDGDERRAQGGLGNVATGSRATTTWTRQRHLATGAP